MHIGDGDLSDPFSTYRALRTYGPVQRVSTGPDTALWLVTGHEAAPKMAADARLSTDPATISAAIRERFTKDCGDAEMNARAGHYTTVLRSFIQHANKAVHNEFPEGAATELRDPFERVTHALLDSFAGTENSIDLVADFAMPYAVHSVCELVGIAEHDRADVTEWLDLIILSPSRAIERSASGQLAEKLAALFTARRVHPRRDLLSTLSGRISTRTGATEEDVVHGAILLLVVSVETTFSIIGNMFYRLLTDDVLLDQLRAAPERIPAAVAALLRVNHAQNISSISCATEPIRIADQRIQPGDLVAFTLSDRPPADFGDPHMQQVARCAGGHLAFGYGAHHAFGASYARQQAEVALRIVLRRYPNVRLNARTTELEWLTSPFLRSVRQLPVLLAPTNS
ncbi:pentalenic acid synthase [Tamaricihabitans halophyticus]|uniref:Pentalenic acid synthase n=1 Tax=Tamaricihabitans halophyticus TaxID=1262583 RepID=A0A4R2QVE4_9PSEU|nr:cytochrome P450 [Tamaricihabitans halophyticus]TCP54013.1 pentalenic acid synthase [Tamaricihabitans halophyticus]